MAILRIKVKPRASRNSIDLPAAINGLLTVSVTVSAVDGKANMAVCELLARFAKVPKTSVSITRGHKARIKTVEFTTLDVLPESLIQ